MLYDIGFAIFSLFYLPTLIFKGKLHGDFAERFGCFSKEKRKVLESVKGAIWIQAVSVGEVALCKGLIPAIKEKFPDKKIILSTITKTGNDLARKLFLNDAVVIYFPLDFSFVVKRVIGLVEPRLYIMIETEIWPNFLKELSARSVPSILINGRISDRSFGKYKLAAPFLKKTLRSIGLFCMQSNIDVARIGYLGAPPEKVRMTGNMKFDIDIAVDANRLAQMRERLGLKPGDDLIVAGSTHNGEEEAVLRAFRELSKEFSNLKLLIAPRHIDRVREVESIIHRHGLKPIKLSGFPLNPEPCTLEICRANFIPVFILDTIGHLKDAYAIASIVFIGGSLIKHGGQNPIEPAVLGRPILFGPHMFNFKDVRRMLLDAQSAIEIADWDELLKKIRLLLIDDQERGRMGAKAKEVIVSNRGATAKNIEAIEETLLLKPGHGINSRTGL